MQAVMWETIWMQQIVRRLDGAVEMVLGCFSVGNDGEEKKQKPKPQPQSHRGTNHTAPAAVGNE